MNKYIDAEKLKAEIKRQKHELELSIQSQGDYGQSCHIVAYDNIISLIDSLQQEQPEKYIELKGGQMIPDKIYFGYDEKTHLESYCLEKKGKCQLEYIRKDALLEWIQEVRAIPHENAVARDLAFQEIVSKLNSM